MTNNISLLTFPVVDQRRYENALKAAANSYDLPLDDQKIHDLLVYLSLFIKWNKAYNLSAIRSPEDMLNKHLLDSLSVVAEIHRHMTKSPNHSRFIDVGTGGGLPGIPLAIVLPKAKVHLLDSAGKKTRFLFQVKQSLSLDNVEIHNLRVENYLPNTLFDGVISRAFASLADMTRLCGHLLDEEGLFWAMKGVFPRDELSELEKHYKVESHISLEVPGVIGERCLIVLKK